MGVTGGIQPDILPAIGKRGPGSVTGDDGMVHRFLFCYPERPVVLADLTGYDVSPAATTHYAFLYDMLRSLMHGEDGEPVPIRFTSEGRPLSTTQPGDSGGDVPSRLFLDPSRGLGRRWRAHNSPGSLCCSRCAGR